MRPLALLFAAVTLSAVEVGPVTVLNGAGYGPVITTFGYDAASNLGSILDAEGGQTDSTYFNLSNWNLLDSEVFPVG